MPAQVEDTISKALNSRTIAIVGLSKNPEKASYEVAAYLKSQGYRIVPINPSIDAVLGEKSYPSLSDLPPDLKREIDVVDIFRRPEDVPPIVDQAIVLKNGSARPLVVWMQLGIVNEEAAVKARNAGLGVVMDHCMMIEHRRRSRPSI
jgi:predicted CoA-binding protein